MSQFCPIAAARIRLIGGGFAAVALAAGAMVGAAQEPAAAPPVKLFDEATPLLPPGPTRRWSAPAGAATFELLGEAAAAVLRVSVKERHNQPWVIQSTQGFSEPIRAGDVCVVVLRARLLETSERSGKAYIGVNVQRNVEPWPKLLSEPLSCGKEWSQQVFPFTAKEEIPAGEGGLLLTYGWQPQTVEVADVQLYKFPPGFDARRLPQPVRSYDGREPDAAWRQAALREIERLRKGELVVRVVDAAGHPLVRQPVTVKLARHHFGFGSAIAAARFQEQSPDGERYRAIVEKHFSRVVLENDLKTKPFQQAQRADGGVFDVRKIDATLDRMRECGIAVRGHYLCWGNTEDWSEEMIAQGKAGGIKDVVLDHARRVTTFAGDRVLEWDAINHPVPFAHILPEYLGDGIYADLMRAFRGMTDRPLWINEDCIDLNRGAAYEKALADLKARGIRIDGAGNMSHYRDTRIPPVHEVREQIDRLAAIAGRVQVTEYDLESDDDALHADHLRDMLILHFAHPACTGFVMWGFWEGRHWRPRAALWRKDWSERPAAGVWQEWVGRRWHTEVAGSTDANGEIRTRGFYGRYHVSVGGGPAVVVEFKPGQDGPLTVVPAPPLVPAKPGGGEG